MAGRSIRLESYLKYQDTVIYQETHIKVLDRFQQVEMLACFHYCCNIVGRPRKKPETWGQSPIFLILKLVPTLNPNQTLTFTPKTPDILGVIPDIFGP